MKKATEKKLDDFLNISYPYMVFEDEGERFITFPDLPGCMTQIDKDEDVQASSEEIKELWIETSFETGVEIPEGPARDFSGKLVLRLPKSLHRDLTYQAREEGMSLNALIVHLLSERSIQSRIESLLKYPEHSKPSARSRQEISTVYQFVEPSPLTRHRTRRSGSTVSPSNDSKERPKSKYTFAANF